MWRVVFLAAGTLLGCGRSGDTDQTSSAAEPQRMADGQKESKGAKERGQYLATAVTLCAFCHSEIDWKAEGFPPKAGTVGGGRAPFNENVPWLVSPNISPDKDTGAGTWTDAQLDNALRRGIAHDGTTLYPAMPYHQYHGMSDDDAKAIVVFLRSIPPVKHKLPDTQMPEEVKSTLTPLPAAGGVKAPERSATAPYGEYLARIGLCGNCHTPRDQAGKPLPGMDLAGGVRLKGPWGEVLSLNITPDASGIDEITDKIFMAAMKTGHLPGGARLSAIMPWGYYQHMTDDDLHALFAFLKTVKPVKHFVDNTSPPTPCKKCGGTHGLGSKND
jgi:cytochrome c553